MRASSRPIGKRIRASLLALLLAGLAIAVRIVVPPGYMAAPSAQAGIAAIMPCPSVAAPVAHDHLGHGGAPEPAREERPPKDPPSDHICVFASLHAVAVSEPTGPGVTTAWTTATPVIWRATPVRADRMAAAPPPSTGPPGTI